MSIGALRATKQKAIDEATHKLKDFIGKEKLTKAIADGIGETGPRPEFSATTKGSSGYCDCATEPKAEAEAATRRRNPL